LAEGRFSEAAENGFETIRIRRDLNRSLKRPETADLSPARLASSITITQRYIHPQADAIERAFAPFGAESVTSAQGQENREVGTKLGTATKLHKAASP
jgi:hypothetical protein